MSIQYRSEHDSVGERSVPKDVYYLSLIHI